MNAARWVGCGFVATAANASPDIIAGWDPIKMVCPQIAYGEGPPGNDPDLSHTRRLIAACHDLGLDVAGWAWGNDAGRAEEEARYHASIVADLDLDAFIINLEAPYDAYGDQSNPKMWAPDYYADEFRRCDPDCELGVTTTPRWASSGNQLRAAGAVMMGQAFSGEVADATVPAVVSHAEAWGWTRSIQRPLIQVYTTNGVRPDPTVYNRDSEACEVGVVPYILEQCFDSPDTIATLAPSITRPPKASSGGGQPPQTGPPPLDLPHARPLYPPDAPEKGGPSADGPDIEAVQRALARAGYREWGSFDQAYSNDLAHGTGNWRGAQGFQHDHVDTGGKAPTGWYGKATHDALVAYVLPSGPNAGQLAFDQRAVELYRQAY